MAAGDPDDPFRNLELPVGDWVRDGVEWSAVHGRATFQALRWPFAQMLDWITGSLVATPAPILLLGIGLLVWQLLGVRRAAIGVLGFAVLGVIGVWTETMVTLAIVVTAVSFCVLFGVPLGIAMARSKRLENVIRPVLDVMQTVPTFVYLVPIAMLVGIGSVPGVMATVFFAVAPSVRMTTLGIRQVPAGLIDAARALGLRPRQILLRIELPLASGAIMAGINQTVLMGLAMCVTTSMIGADGLGLLVLRGIGSMDMGLAAQGGIGIVLLGIMLDRLTQGLAARQRSDRTKWSERSLLALTAAVAGRMRGRWQAPSIRGADPDHGASGPQMPRRASLAPSRDLA